MMLPRAANVLVLTVASLKREAIVSIDRSRGRRGVDEPPRRFNRVLDFRGGNPGGWPPCLRVYGDCSVFWRDV